MANEEALTLDGLALNDGVTFGMVKFDAPVPRQRQDWIGAADSETQLLVRNPLHDNRKITVRLAVIAQASMNVAHDKLLLVLDKLQKASKYTDGISLTWTPATGTRTATFDVLSAEIVDLPIDWENGWLSFSPEFTVEMTAKPYWRGTETLTSTASSSTPFVTLEVASVTGDVPALGRLIVTDTATQSRRHVEWGLEGPLTYNAATSLLVDSDSMITSGFSGAQAVVAGAYDPNAAGNSTINSASYGQPIAVCGTGNLSHIGSFRVKARVTTTASAASFRLTWRAGDGSQTSNGWVSPNQLDRWEELDLGTITIPQALSGTQRWTGQVETYAPSGVPGSVSVDYLILVPAADGYGKARAPYSYQPGVIVGTDSFTSTTAAAALNTRVAPLGGTWVTSGDATDFVFADLPAATDETVKRSVTAGTAGRFGLLGTSTPSDVEVQASHYIDLVPSTVGTWVDCAVVARYVDASNYLYATFRRTVTTSATTRAIEIRQVVAGVETLLASGEFPAALASTFAWWTVRLIAYASGTVIGHLLAASGQTMAATSGASTAVATGGALATGKSGILDRNTSAVALNRYYDNVFVSIPAAETVALYSGRNMQIRYDDVIRQDSTGTYTGRPSSYRGSRFLLPVGTSRVLVKARRNDIEAAADDNVTDATQIQVGWTPRGLAVPR